MAAAGSRGKAFRQRAQGKERVPARPLVGIKAKPVPALNGMLGKKREGRVSTTSFYSNKEMREILKTEQF